MSTYIEERIRSRLHTYDPEKRRRAEKFLADQATFRAAEAHANAAWAEYEGTPRWRFLKRRKLLRAACFTSASFFRVAGDDKAARLMLSRA